MCIIQAGYFTKSGSGMSGPSCSAYANDIINEDVIATFSASELNKSYGACMSIRKPGGTIVAICGTYRTVTSTTETFMFADWTRPITTLGLYEILESRIYDNLGNIVCYSIASGGFCQSMTVSAPPCATPAVALTIPA